MNLFVCLLKLRLIFHFNWMLAFQFGERANLQSFYLCFRVGLVIFVIDMFVNLTGTSYKQIMNIIEPETKRLKKIQKESLIRQEQAGQATEEQIKAQK